jgi:cell division protein FtsA
MIMACAHPDGRLEMMASGFADSRGLVKGIVVDQPEAVASILRAAGEVESRSKRSADSVVAGISGSHIQSYNFRGSVPVRGKNFEVTTQDMESAIHAARSVPLPPEREIIHVLPREFFLNKHGGITNPVGLSGSQLDADLHVISCDSSMSQRLVSAANKAQIEVKKVILQSIASGEAVLTPEEKELGTVVIDIGSGTTDIAVYLKNSICFTSVIPVGGENFTRDLVEALHTSREEANRIKLEFGNVMPELISPEEAVTIQGLGLRGTHDFPRRKICEFLHDRGAELLEIVRGDILHSGVRDKLVAGAVFTGGGSMMGGLLEVAETVLNMPVRLGLPMGFDGLQKELAHPSYACAVGLTLIEAQKSAQKDFSDMPPPVPAPSLVDRILSWFEN